MKRKKYNTYLGGIDNILFITKNNCWRYNKYGLNSLGLKGVKLWAVLLFSPLLFFLIVFYAVLYVTFKFIQGVIIFSHDEYSNVSGDNLFLLFTPLLIDRCKRANLYSESNNWIIGPNVNSVDTSSLPGTIIGYKECLKKSDSFRIFRESLLTLFGYIKFFPCLQPVYNVWDYYEVKVSLEKIAPNNRLYFSNQSDRWALLFDEIKSNGKTLLQHGIALNWGKVPYMLHQVDEFYAISNQTWQDAYNYILDSIPSLKIMRPTIELKEVKNEGITVLIVSEITHIKLEERIIKFLNEKGVIIYLKKHPYLTNDMCYLELQQQYGFRYITDKFFPKVDFVISYFSTLAYEYMAWDIPVYVYDSEVNFDFNVVEEMLSNILIEHK